VKPLERVPKGILFLFFFRVRRRKELKKDTTLTKTKKKEAFEFRLCTYKGSRAQQEKIEKSVRACSQNQTPLSKQEAAQKSQAAPSLRSVF